MVYSKNYLNYALLAVSNETNKNGIPPKNRFPNHYQNNKHNINNVHNTKLKRYNCIKQAGICIKIKRSKVREEYKMQPKHKISKSNAFS